MAQEIQVNIWCDGVKLGAGGEAVLRHEARTVKGVTRTHGLDGRPAKHVDLCDDCDSNLSLDELRAVLKEFGVAVEAGKNKRATDQRYPAVGGGMQAIVARAAMSGQRQGRAPKGERKMDCLWCPLDYTQSGFLGHVQKQHGFSGTKEALGSTCPKCGPSAGDFDMVSVHITRSHPEFESITDAFFWAKDNGDPHGVWEERRNAGKNIVEALT